TTWLGIHLQILFPGTGWRSRRASARWGWLLLSLVLMVLSGVFLYPPLESLTLSPRLPAVKTPAPTPPAPPPVEVAPVESAEVPVETIGKWVTPPKPLRQAAPSVPPGIRTRINGTIPIEVTVHIGANGAVTRIEAPRKGD